MLLQTETGSKKHIIAERFFETEILENLTKLLISDYKNFQVLSLYSDLSNKLLAFKIIQQEAQTEDIWLHTTFLKKFYVDFQGDFEILPLQFSESKPIKDAGSIFVNSTSTEDQIHFSRGLILYNQIHPNGSKVNLYRWQEKICLFIFQDKKCVFANSFACSSDTESLYYILNAMQISGISQDSVSLYLDYNLASDKNFLEFIQPYFLSIQNLKPEFENPDTEIPFLPELLFANHACSICV